MWNGLPSIMCILSLPPNSLIAAARTMGGTGHAENSKLQVSQAADTRWRGFFPRLFEERQNA